MLAMTLEACNCRRSTLELRWRSIMPANGPRPRRDDCTRRRWGGVGGLAFRESNGTLNGMPAESERLEGRT